LGPEFENLYVEFQDLRMTYDFFDSFPCSSLVRILDNPSPDRLQVLYARAPGTERCTLQLRTATLAS
jgi:hypothetical protein